MKRALLVQGFHCLGGEGSRTSLVGLLSLISPLLKRSILASSQSP